MPKKRKKANGAAAGGAVKRSKEDEEEEEKKGDGGGNDAGDDGVGDDGGVDATLLGVVKVFCATTRPNAKMPWQMQSQRSCTGTGCLVNVPLASSGEEGKGATKSKGGGGAVGGMGGRRILTNAHVVAFGTTITLLKHGNPKRYLCRIVSFGHEYDLALLEVVEDAEEFWENAVPFELGDLPPLNSGVLILGYPTSIDSVSVTEGVISRVMADEYSQSGENLLKLQVDAAINPGNSGGPALVNNKLIGLVSEVMADSQGIGFAIPAQVVRHFLQQVDVHKIVAPDQHYPGICTLGINWTPCNNPSQREFYRLEKKEHGVVVVSVLPLSDAKEALRSDDILMSVDGLALADDGTIELRRSGERVRWTHAVSKKFAGDTVALTVKRSGATVHVRVTLTGAPSRFTQGKQIMNPPYIVFSGLVFLECSNDYLEAVFPGEDGNPVSFEGMPINLQLAWYRQEKTSHDHQVVILSQVLCDNLCLGYTSLKNRVVEKINNTPVKNIAQINSILSTLAHNPQPPKPTSSSAAAASNKDSKSSSKDSTSLFGDGKSLIGGGKSRDGRAGVDGGDDEKEGAHFITVELDQGQKLILDTRKAFQAHPEILKRNNIHPPSSIPPTA